VERLESTLIQGWDEDTSKELHLATAELSSWRSREDTRLPTGFDKFRPISLCLVFYKICSKVIVHHLTILLPKIISLEQGAFIPGRSIFENISLT